MSFSYKFDLDNPEILPLTNMGANFWNQVLMVDSIFDYYPALTVQFLDSPGLVTDRAFFIEGLKFTADLGPTDSNISLAKGESPENESNRLKHNFIWSELHCPNPVFNLGKVTGNVIMNFISEYRLKDSKKSASYQGTIASTVRQVVGSYGFQPQNLKISNTGNRDYWYQVNQLDSAFIQANLGQQAVNVSSTNPKSPFYTFINLKNEFYFQSIEDMFRQPAVAELTLFSSAESGTKDNILDFNTAFGGYSQNANNYSIGMYSVGPTGSYTRVPAKLSTAVTKSNGASKITALNSTVNSKQFYDYKYFGILTSTDIDNNIGFQNNFFRDSVLNYRLTATVDFNPKLVSGHVVSLEVNSTIDDTISSEYSGKWLIIESKHGMGNRGNAFSKITLAKSTVNVRPNHPFMKQAKFLI